MDGWMDGEAGGFEPRDADVTRDDVHKRSGSFERFFTINESQTVQSHSFIFFPHELFPQMQKNSSSPFQTKKWKPCHHLLIKH